MMALHEGDPRPYGLTEKRRSVLMCLLMAVHQQPAVLWPGCSLASHKLILMEMLKRIKPEARQAGSEQKHPSAGGGGPLSYTWTVGESIPPPPQPAPTKGVWSTPDCARDQVFPSGASHRDTLALLTYLPQKKRPNHIFWSNNRHPAHNFPK